jgi:hypothetical protein
VRFALRTADALAGTLNFRRTVHCVVDLAVPYFGRWAGVTVVEGGGVRRVDSLGRDDLAGRTRPLKLAELGPAADELRQATTDVRLHRGPVAPDVITAFGLPPGPAEGLAGSGVLVTAALGGAHGYGVLAIAADEPPDLGEVREFADRAARAMAFAHAYQERATLARTLRAALVPPPLPAIAGFDLGAAYRPAQETTQIGGDFYDLTPRPDGKWALSIGDVCGKGVDAAVLTGQVRQSLRTASLVTDDPVTALELLNETLLRTDGTTFATAAYGLLAPGPERATLQLASGGHPPPFLLRDGAVTALPVRGTLIGMLEEVSFAPAAVELRPEDVLLFYTDGAPEARGPAGMLGTEPIVRLLADSGGLRAQAIADRILQLVMEHLHGWPHDDIALLSLRRTSGG